MFTNKVMKQIMTCKLFLIFIKFFMFNRINNNLIFRFLSRLSQQRRTNAENKSVAPTLPLPLLNKPSPNIKEIKPTVETQSQKLVDSKTQDIAQKMFPANKSPNIQTELSKISKI